MKNQLERQFGMNFNAKLTCESKKCIGERIFSSQRPSRWQVGGSKKAQKRWSKLRRANNRAARPLGEGVGGGEIPPQGLGIRD